MVFGKISFKKLKEELSVVAVMIMYYGTFIALGLLLIGIAAYLLNISVWGSSYNNYIWSIKIITSAQSLLVQSFLYALIFECVRLGRK